MIIIDSNVVKKSIEHYGDDLQTVVCMEECSELIQAISKMKRGKDNRDNLIEEVADVMLVLETLAVNGVSRAALVIGGSFGLADEVKQRACLRLSFSPMTFPHQLARVMLLDQLYRAAQIQNGGKYHK